MNKQGIAVIGSTTIDKIIRGNFSWFKIGGATAYAGITYSRHGIKTRVVTNVANRDLEIVRRLQAEQIVVCNGQTAATTYFINYIDGSNQRQKIPQRAKLIGQSQIIENVKDLSIVHLGPLHASDLDSRVIKLLTNLGLSIVLDAQGLSRSVKNKSVHPSVSKHLPAFFGISQIVKANKHEYKSIIDFFEMDLLELLRHFKINEFVVTAGHSGGFVQTITGEKIQYPATAVKVREDPTGAGDVFLAAYVIGRYLNRWSIVNSCEYAAKLAARQIEGNYITPDDLRLLDRKEDQF